MSNSSATSSVTTNVRANGRVAGVPKRCWCGEHIVAKISKSGNNSYRRYYRCYSAVVQKVDDALLDEIESVSYRNARLEKEVKDIHKLLLESMKFQKKAFEYMEMKVEAHLCEKINNELLEAKSYMRNMMTILVVDCMFLVGFIKLMKI